jgi:hypothetical protein
MPKPGDFGLVAISGEVGRLIRFGQLLNGDGWDATPDPALPERRTAYQHAVLVLPSGELIEAEPGGARIRPVSEYDGTNVVWSDWPLTDAERAAIVAAGRSLEGVPYSAADYFALAAHRLHLPVPGLRRFVASSGHMICSQLVDEAYRRAGLAMFADHRWPGYVTPMALVRALHGPVV